MALAQIGSAGHHLSAAAGYCMCYNVWYTCIPPSFRQSCGRWQNYRNAQGHNSACSMWSKQWNILTW